MGSKNTPKAPDYTAAADKQATSSREITDAQTWANRPNQNTPWGSTSWSTDSAIDPATGKPYTSWTQNTTLDPRLQGALDNQFELQGNKSELANSMYGRLSDEYSKKVNFGNYLPMGDAVGHQTYSTDGLPSLDDPSNIRQHAEDAMYSKATSRLDPQWQQQTAQKDAQLRNQGLAPGDEAYDTAMRNLQMDKTDAYNQAMFSATDAGRAEADQMFGQKSKTREQLLSDQLRTGTANQDQAMKSSAYQTQLRQQQIAEEMQRRGYTLNEINAILNGQQVSMPNMPSFTSATKSETPNYMGAAQNQYNSNLDSFNAEQAAYQGMMSGVGSIAGGFMPL